jgi:hypothetical protein
VQIRAVPSLNISPTARHREGAAHPVEILQKARVFT